MHGPPQWIPQQAQHVHAPQHPALQPQTQTPMQLGQPQTVLPQPGQPQPAPLPQSQSVLPQPQPGPPATQVHSHQNPGGQPHTALVGAPQYAQHMFGPQPVSQQHPEPAPSPSPSGSSSDSTLEGSTPESIETPEDSDVEADEEGGAEEEKETKIRGLLFILEFQRLYEILSQSRSRICGPLALKNHSERLSEGAAGFEFAGRSQADGASSPRGSSEPGGSNGFSDKCTSTVGTASLSKRRRTGGDGITESDEDENNPPPPVKRPRKKDIRSLGGMLACPFAKGCPKLYPQCLVIGRQNLSGIKEHIKRNHHDQQLLLDIRPAKKWNDVFDKCNPEWPLTQQPRPSPYVDLVERLQQIQPIIHDPQDMIGVATSSSSQNFCSSLNDSIDNPECLQHRLISDPIASIGNGASFLELLDPSWSPKRLFELIQGINQNSHSDVSPNPEVSQFSGFDQAIMGMAGPELSLGTGIGTSALRRIHDMNGQINRQHEIMWPEFGINRMQSSEQVWSDIANSVGYNPLEQGAQVEDAMGNLRNTHWVPEGSIHSNKSGVSKKYLLWVSRNPEVPSEIEKPGQKRFRFDNFDEFSYDFESWMTSQFIDPPFCWEKMILFNDQRKAFLGTLEDVIEDIQATTVHYRAFDAALYLKLRNGIAQHRQWKGKARVHETGYNANMAAAPQCNPSGATAK
ncbi:hypothetical protein TWF191_004481 [Orbilia oligospora]|uniref:Uncharacterized protein n=1 Tax=Orbilia oligospora TaxID=2813651 RepID=A0A7C8QZ02_ORBOL|nr:hypothetical protein TWF191_004481 [Orbilia oligospora]